MDDLINTNHCPSKKQNKTENNKWKARNDAVLTIKL